MYDRAFYTVHIQVETGTIVALGVSPIRLKQYGCTETMAVNILCQSYFIRVGIVVKDPPKRVLDCFGWPEASNGKWDEKQVYLLQACDRRGGGSLRHLSDVIAEWGQEFAIHQSAAWTCENEWKIINRQIFERFSNSNAKTLLVEKHMPVSGCCHCAPFLSDKPPGT
jgi:hypothetical protein